MNEKEEENPNSNSNKRIACIECRQQKVRCDAHENYPKPCTRCTKKILECVLQPDFKRTSKRRRMVELEQEMQSLRQSVEYQETTKKKIATGSLLELSNTAVHYTHEPEELPAPLFVPKKKEESPQEPMPSSSSSSSSSKTKDEISNIDYNCQPKSLDNVTLNTETIKNLFHEFVTNYHPFLPVVDVPKGPERIYRQCPSLFWTIMAVASRRYDKDAMLMNRLASLLKNILSEVTISPVTRFVSGESNDPNQFNVASVFTVQAFLIYTMWPPLTSSISADSSWNAAGVAIFSGIRVGLHCPGYSRDFSRVKADKQNYPKINEQTKTWLCCNAVSQTVATVFGFPSFTNFDASVTSACAEDSKIDIPESIRQMTIIQQLENEVEKTLNSNTQDPLGLSELSERLSLVQIMSRKMDELEMKIGKMDDYRRYMLLAARVHLMTYYFLDNGGFSTLQLQKGLVQAYNSALALLYHTDEAAKRNSNFMRYLPGIHVQALWQCTAIIIKVYHSSFAEFVDAARGKDLYFKTVHHLSKASILKHDMAYRGAEIMQQVWQLFEDLARREAASSRISIRTRMAASVFFDILWTMREECGIRSVAPAVLKERNTDNTVPNPQPVYDIPQQTNVQSHSQQPHVNQAGGQSGGQAGPNQQQFDMHLESQFNGMFDWDVDVAWRDVDMMMTDLGFHIDDSLA